MQIWGLGWNIRQDEAIFLFTVGQQWVIWSNEREKKNYRNWNSRKCREKKEGEHQLFASL